MTTKTGSTEPVVPVPPQHAEEKMLRQAMLLAKQVQLSPLFVLFVAACMAFAFFKQKNLWLALTWLSTVAFCLGTRFWYARSVQDTTDAAQAKRILNNLTMFALINGLAMGLSAPLFFNGLDDVRKAWVGLILVSLSAGGIATSAGCPRVFAAYALPALLPLAITWALTGDSEHVLLGAMILCFIAILYKFVTDNNRIFNESFAYRYEREQLIQQLENKHQELSKAMNAAQEERARAEEAGQAKARVLAAASHDLRQPLHALSLYSAVLAQHPEPATLAEVAQQIDLSVRGLSALLNALLDISRLDAGVYKIECRSFSVHDALRRITHDFEAIAQKKGLMLYLDSKPVYAYSDPVVFEQIARNLIDNALKYTDDGAVLVTVSQEDESLRVAVHDTGKGIPEYERERVFEEFYQLNNPSRDRERGLGLGLSIVKRLAELVQSKIVLHSVAGEGSCFSWHLPLERRGVPPVMGADVESGGVTVMSEKKQILVIEDEAAIRHGMGLLLRTWGMEAHGCDSQKAAEAILQQHKIDLIIADLRLSDGVNGLKVVQELRTQFGLLPVILISGETDPNQLRDVANSDLPLMNKPIQPELLRKNLLQMLDSA